MGRARVPSRWPLIADDLFRVAHDDWGRLRLHADVVGAALGAAVLAELVLEGFATTVDGMVAAHPDGEPVDPFAATVLRLIRAERRAWSVRDWMRYLTSGTMPGGDSYEQVTRRLALAGHLHTKRKGVFRRKLRCTPVDVNAAAWPWVRLSRAAHSQERLDSADTVLAGLILATDLHRKVLTGAAGDLEDWLRSNVDDVRVDLRDLLYQAETAVAAAVTTGA
ncbi:GPP34 family phosphoprotein [Actinoplanes sp. NPDC051859]|uniref:GOLPH3/VPS74 family protein n=1 Tax=Actinoplanes sp. NPDC051859 TaxID=3363909 RepID=UPI0037B18B8C